MFFIHQAWYKITVTSREWDYNTQITNKQHEHNIGTNSIQDTVRLDNPG